MSKRVREPQTSGSPAVDIVTDEAQAGLRIRAEGTGNALEVVGPSGVLFSIDKNGVPSAGGSGGGASILADVTLGSDGASFSTPTLDLSTWFLVRVIAQIRAQDAGELAGAAVRAVMRFNDDAGVNYLWGVQEGDNGAFTKTGDAGYTSGIEALWGSGSNFSAQYFGTNEYDIVLPGSSSIYKHVTYQGGAPSATTQMLTGFGSAIWKSTSPITKITLMSNDGSLLDAGSRMRVIGLVQA